jgi:glutathione S-transferase
MKLYATPLSHFSRKVRTLLDLYSISYEFIDCGNVAQSNTHNFGKNPMMKVPVLVDGDHWIIESDHIALYLVKKYDETDKFQVQTTNSFDLNARAVMNGIMSEEVKLILAERTAVPTKEYSFFSKAYQAIESGLSWLETNSSHFDPQSPKYREIHLISMWDHLDYYEIVPLEYKNLRKIVSQVSDLPLLKKSHPNLMKPK